MVGPHSADLGGALTASQGSLIRTERIPGRHLPSIAGWWSVTGAESSTVHCGDGRMLTAGPRKRAIVCVFDS